MSFPNILLAAAVTVFTVVSLVSQLFGNKKRHPKQPSVRTVKFSGFTLGPLYMH